MEINVLNRKGQKLFCIVDVPNVQNSLRGNGKEASMVRGLSEESETLNFTSKPNRHLNPNPITKTTATPRSFPAVLIVHGFKGFSTQTHIAAISASLARAGFLTIRPDLTKNPGRSYLDFADMTYTQEYEDLEDILDNVLKMPQVDASRIGITGHSLGGMLVAELAAKKDEIKSLVTLSAVYDFRFVVKKIFKKTFDRVKKDFAQKGESLVWSQSLHKDLLIKKKFYEDVFFRNSAKFAKDIICPTLVIAGENDQSVPVSHADRYLKTVSSEVKKMEIISRSDHNYTTAGLLDRVTKLVTDWFAKTL